MATNRYQDLLGALPLGRFYDSTGYIVPYRSEAQNFRFETGKPSQKYGIFVNDVYSGITTTDGLGIAILSLILRQGRSDIRIVDEDTQETFRSYVDARRIATWYAGYSDVISKLDQDGEDIYNARSLLTVKAPYTEATYGRDLTTPNDSGYSNLSYVNALQELRQAYRKYGGMPRGLRSAVSALTSSSPIDVPLAWRPTWRLGEDLVRNSHLQEFARTSISQYKIAGLDLPNINSVSRSYIKASILDNAVTLVYAPTNQPPIPQRITITVGAAWAGGPITFLGKDATGHSISETLNPAASLNSTIATTLEFAVLTSITKTSVAGAGASISIGTAESRFVKLLHFGSYNATGTPISLAYTAGPNRLSWGGGDALTIDATVLRHSRHILTDVDLVPTLYGLHQSPYSTDPNPIGNSTGQLDQLYLRLNNGLVTRYDLSGFTPTITAAQVALVIGIPASIITGDQGVNGQIVKLVSALAGPNGHVTIVPGAFDVGPSIFGMPRDASTLAAPVAPNATSLTVVDGSQFEIPTTAPVQAEFVLSSPNIVGVALLSPSITTTLGIGQLQLVVVDATYKTLAYRAPADAIFGPPVQVVNGGDFILLADNTVDVLNVTVDAASLNVTNALTVYNDNIRIKTPGAYPIRIRGRRYHAVDGQITGSILNATFSSASASFNAKDLGGAIRITGGTAVGVTNNNGIHIITAILSSTSVTIKNQGYATGIVFVNQGPGLTYSLWSPGEVHTVNKRVGNVLSIDEPMVMAWPGNTAVYVEHEAQTTSDIAGRLGIGDVTIEIDPVFAPAPPKSDNVTLIGTNIPDGWNTTGVTSAKQGIVGHLATSRTILQSAASVDMTFFTRVPHAEDFTGLPLVATFWIQEHTAASNDYRIDVWLGGLSPWLIGTPVSIAGTVLDYTPPEGSLDPVPVSRTFFAPHGTTEVWVRIVRISDGVTTPATFSVARMMVTAVTHNGFYLGHNTIPRSNQRTNFDELIYVWSPEPLLATEKTTLGLTSDGQPSATSPGHIDTIMPAHEMVERYDVSEYEQLFNAPINILGVYTDNDWVTKATLTNMQIVVGTPGKQTYVRPIRISEVVAEPLTFTAGVGGVDSFALAQPIGFEGAIPFGIPDGRDTLMELATRPIAAGDIEVVPDTIDDAAVQPWNWISGNRLHIDSAYYDSSSTYYMTYQTMMRVEAAPIQLNALTMADYVWLIDVALFQRTDLQRGNDPKTEQVGFKGDFTAALSSRSNQDLATSVLIADNGLIQTTVAQANWSYVNADTIKINSSVFDPNSLYSLSYTSLYPRISSPAHIRIDWRSGATAIALAAAPWSEVRNGEPVNPVDVDGTYSPFHQIRITVFGVIDVRDLRIYGVGLKGVHLYGVDAYAPGIVV